MTFKRKASGSFTNITATVKRKASGAWAQIGLVKRRSAGAWTTVWASAAITAQNVISSAPTGSRTGGYRLNTSGIVEERIQAAYSTLETWLVGGTSSDHEVRATLVSGTSPTTGTVGSWLALSSSREWTNVATTPNKFSELLIEIRTVAGVVVSSATVTIEAGNA